MNEQIPLLDVDPSAPREDEFYETPRWQVEALLRRIYLPAHSRVVEPCAGNGAISRVLSVSHLLYVWTNDSVQRDLKLGSCGDATKRDTWQRFVDEFGTFDAVITNVPFSLALPIIDHAIQFAPLVATILRRTWDEPTDDRGPWLKANPCAGQIVMPRHSYRGEGSDSVTSAWFIWADPGIVRPFDVVTKAERDELIARFGPR